MRSWTSRHRSQLERAESAATSVASFAKMSPLQRLAFDAMAFSISPARIEELRKTFEELDTDGSGTLSLDEVQRLVGAQGGAEQAFDALDLGGAKEVTYTEFIAAMVSAQERFQDDEHIRAAFEELDKDGSGTISLDEVIGVIGESADKMMLDGADTDGDGKVDFAEFKRLVKTKPAADAVDKTPATPGAIE